MLSTDYPIWLNILLLLAGLAIVTKGADKFVDSAVAIAQRTNVSKAIIGATIVSLGTTLPEFSVTALGGVFDRSQTAMGNAIGSAVCNIGLVLGMCVLIKPVLVQRRLYWQAGAIMLLAGVLVTLLSLDGYLSRWDSLILTAGLLGFLCFSVRKASPARKDVRDRTTDMQLGPRVVATPISSLRGVVAWFVLGAIAVAVGAILIVQNAVVVASWLGIPELIIGLTVVAFGTSLPELVTGLMATVKGHGEIMLGNIIGADIMDIFWVLGPGALSFSRLPVERQTMLLDYPAMLLLMVLLLIMTTAFIKLPRWHGGVLLGIYGVYLALMFPFFA